MTDFEAIRDDLARFAESVAAMGNANQRFVEAANVEIDRLWDRCAELGDGLVALSNRIESVARSVATPFDPPEAA